MRAIDPFLNPLLAQTAYCFSGGSPKVPKAETLKMPETPKMDIPTPPAPLPIPPPPSTSDAEVQQAESDQRTQAAKRNGMRKTLLSGETGGYKPATTTTGKKTLLG